MELDINQLETEISKLIRAYTRLRNENNDIRKQMAVLEMEHTMLNEKYNEANLTIMNLTDQLGTFEVHHE